MNKFMIIGFIFNKKDIKKDIFLISKKINNISYSMISDNKDDDIYNSYDFWESNNYKIDQKKALDFCNNYFSHFENKLSIV